MSLFNRTKQNNFNEFIDIIEWTNDTADTMIWRFPRQQAKIKSGAQLIVCETQVAVLVNEGRFADVYQPGRYELTSNNMPILSTQKGWKYGFNLPFNVDVCFVSTKQFLNKRWGTVNPIMMYDREFGPIRLRALGSYCFRIEPNPIKFIRNVAGTDGNFNTESVTERLRNFVITKFTDYLIESRIAVLDLAANLNEFSSELNIALKGDFSEYGIELTKFSIENISLPEAVEEALDKRSSMGVIGNMNAYIQTVNPQNGQTVEYQPKAEQTHNLVVNNPQHPTPPPMPSQQMYHVAVSGVQKGPLSIAQLQQMAQEGQFTPDTLVWRAGMASWVVAKLVPSLSQLFGEFPPPI
ncbi:MAG: SPFH domain-containing protein [Bacteroidales bacterium]|nr:SPFH domain-containing protein [Bacteroidales bacterium]